MKSKVMEVFKLIGLLFFTIMPVNNLHAVTLNEVLQDIVTTNPDILARQKAYNAALSAQKNARSGFFPKVIFIGDTGWKDVRDSGTGYEFEDDGFYRLNLSASQLLWDYGRTSAFLTAREKETMAAFYSYLGVSNTIAFQTINAYLEVLKCNELQEVAFKSVMVHKRLLAQVKMQIDRGKKGRSQLERANGRLAAAQSRLMLRQNDFKQSLYTLHKLLGRFVTPDEMQMPKFNMKNLPGSLNDAVFLQAANHPVLHEAAYNIEKERYDYQYEKRDVAGRLSLEASINVDDEFDSDNEHEVDGRIFLRYRNTLFDNGRKHKVQRIVSRVHEEQQKEYEARRSLINDIQMCWAAYKLREEQIPVLKKNLYYSRRSLESYKEEFIIGKRSLINILDAQNEYQYIEEQLIDALYSLETEKYRILYSEGLLLSRLNLITPKASAMMDKDAKRVALSRDTLPVSTDFDNDKVADNVDVSVNSLAGDEVSELGISSKYDAGYIYQKAKNSAKPVENMVKKGDSLKKLPIDIGVTTHFDYNVFVKGKVRVDNILLNKHMKDLILQAKTHSAETPFYIISSSNEEGSTGYNYNLALKRAYNLKKILQEHRIDKNGIFVFADTNAPEGGNTLRVKFVNKLADYDSQYRTQFVTDRIFGEKNARIINPKPLSLLAEQIKNNSGSSEIVVYCNAMKNLAKNQALCDKRVDSIRNWLTENGIEKDKVVLFSWGKFKQDPLTPKHRRTTQMISCVLR